jgi:putative mycofactocin binding protein MftB
LTGAWELDPMVALRPEPFGALAYHYRNRRLTFLRSPDLVDVLRTLGDHESVDDAMAAHQIEPRRRPAFARALESLADSEVIRPRG